MPAELELRPSTVDDVPVILELIKELADYERLSHEVVADEAILTETLFGPKSHAEAILGLLAGDPVGFALFFHNYSTFLGRPGIYLEDLFVRPHARGQGIGKMLMGEVARIAVERQCGRLEWSVLNWNAPSIAFYEMLGARPQSDWTVMRLTGEALIQLAAGQNL